MPRPNYAKIASQMEAKHHAEPAPGTTVGNHARCTCGKIVQSVIRPRGGLDQRSQGAFLADERNWYWKHVSDPTSPMIPGRLRDGLGL